MPPFPITSPLPGPEGDNYPAADAGAAHGGLDSDAGDSDTWTHVGLHVDESSIYTGVHAPDPTTGTPGRPTPSPTQETST